MEVLVIIDIDVGVLLTMKHMNLVKDFQLSKRSISFTFT